MSNYSPREHRPFALSVYWTRWQALDSLIAGQIEHYARLDFPRKPTILYLLTALREFGAGQFKQFYFGLNADGAVSDKYAKLEPNPRYPAADMLAGILELMGNDLELIQRAANQRIHGSETMRRTLANADKLAWLAVKPAMDYAAIEESTTVLTYFQKSPIFYAIPYAQVALIGIPATAAAADSQQDYLAIPHEVGHYVYRHLVGHAGKDLKELRKGMRDELNHIDAIQQSPSDKAFKQWFSNIMEELFADAYGCFIGGPIMAVSAQELAMSYARDRFVSSNDEHPNPIVRPFLYCLILQEAQRRGITKDTWQPLVNELVQHWQATLKTLGIEPQFVTNYRKWNDATTMMTLTKQTWNIKVNVSPSTDATVASKTGAETFELVFTPAATAAESDKVTDAAIALQPDVLKNLELVWRMFGHDASWQGDNITGEIRESINSILPDEHPQRGWAGEITGTTGINELYQNFEKNLPALLASVKLLPPEADPSAIAATEDATDDAVPPLWLEWVKTKLNAPQTEWPPQQSLKSGEVLDPDSMNPGEWGYIFYGDGWANSNPTGSDPGHPLD